MRYIVLHLTPDGDMLASKSKEGTIKIWNPATRQLVSTINTNTGGGIVFSPDGHLLASGDEEGKVVNLWNPNTGELIKNTQRTRWPLSIALHLSPMGQYLPAELVMVKIHLWNIETKELIRVLGAKKVDGLAFSADGNILANGGAADANVKVWNPDTGTPPTYT